MSCGRSLVVAILLCVLAAGGIAAVDAGARVERCGGDGRSAEMRCPAKADAAPARRRSRARLPSEESTIYPKGLARPPAAPAALPPPAQPALPAPVPITSCDPNGCRDAAGTRYNGWGPGMIRSDGKLCQQVGNMMQCN